MAARLCPHCNVRSNFEETVTGRGKWGALDKQIEIQLETLRCHNCGGLIVLRKDYLNAQWIESGVFPASIPSMDSAIPEKVALDFVSGVNCLAIMETKAAAAMFRRSLQRLAIDRKAAGNTLFDQLNWLHHNAGVPQDIIDWAHEIRFWGNEGAHPNTDGLDEITNEEAIDLKAFVETIFQWVYVMPQRVIDSRAKRAARKTSS